MTDDHLEFERLSPERRALLSLRKLQRELETVKRARSEPIAIIGMGCRFPGGADTPEAYWRVLEEGRDTVTEVPPERYDVDLFYDPDIEAPGKTVSRWGAFLEQVDQFDPLFFGISPREAIYLDPQQRLLLEVAWEALERAGLVPQQLARSQTGVFVGIFNHDYIDLQQAEAAQEGNIDIDAHVPLGNGLSFAAGRLSYLLGLHGPSMVVDTTCSSSLVAIHLACQSLRNDECDTAIAAAVNLNLSPYGMVAISKMRALSPAGRCKTMDASADGFVRGEGGGAVVLKRLSRAIADGDTVVAVIRGSAVNHDGRSNGLTAPNGLAQQAVIRQALRNAEVAPEQITFIETHGTGTRLGDPIEFDALRAVFGQPRPDGSECVLGSVKTNIGHLEPAAGMASIIKTVLCMQHGLIPRHLHLKTLNPLISLENTPFAIPTSPRPWPRGERPRLAGVSGAGLSGTNAHVILEEPPSHAKATSATTGTAGDETYLLPLSARDPNALRALVRTYEQSLTPGGSLATTPLRDVCYTASLRRHHDSARVALVAHDRDELIERLRAVASGDSPSEATGDAMVGAPLGPVFVFSGQGAQWAGMGRYLLEYEPVFRDTIEACDRLMRPYVDWSLTAELSADAATSRLHETAVAQAALFATEVALAALWRSWGITPGAVVGHSVGEIAAAHVAGVLTLEDAVRLVLHRGRLMQQAHGRGAMAAVELPETEIGPFLAGYAGRLAVAAVNSPTSLVLSGDADALDEVQRRIEQEGVFCRRVSDDYAFHCPQMEPFRASLVEATSSIVPRPATLPLVSSVTGELASGTEYDAEYWGRNMCQPVRFAPAIDALIRMGYRTFLEVSPQPVLGRPIRQTLAGQGVSGAVLASLRQGVAEPAVLLGSLGTLYARGYAVDWRRLYPSEAGPYRVAPLPTYPWQRQRYWFTDKKPQPPAPGAAGGRATGHALLGHRVRTAARDVIFEARIDSASLPWLRDHQVVGTAIVPASAFVEMLLAGAREARPDEPTRIEDLFIHKALMLPEQSRRLLQLVLSPCSDAGNLTAQISSCPSDLAGEEDEWVLHVSATLATGRTESTANDGEAAAVDAASSLTDILGRCSVDVDVQQHYDLMRAIGMDYGPGFQGLRRIWRGDDEAIAEVVLPAQLHADAARYLIHPALLDACLQVTASSREETLQQNSSGDIYLPVSLDRMDVVRRPGDRLWCHVRLRRDGSGRPGMIADLRLLDDADETLARMDGLHVRRIPREVLGLDTPAAEGQLLYEIQWQQQAHERLASAAAAGDSQGNWLIFADRAGAGSHLAERMRSRGARCVLVSAGRQAELSEPEHMRIADPSDPATFQSLLSDIGNSHDERWNIVYLWGLDAAPTDRVTVADLESDQQAICGGLLHLVQAISQRSWSQTPRLWVVTRGSQDVTGGEDAAQLALSQAALWGLGRTVAIEHPELRCINIDLDPEADGPGDIDALTRDIAYPDREDQVAYRGGERHLPRLVPAAGPSIPQELHFDGTYLITGGMGGIGLTIARWLVEEGGVRHLALSGRRGPSDAALETIAELEQAGAKVIVVQADVSRIDDAAAMMRTIERELPPLRGVIHAAGVVDDGALVQQSWERFAHVLAPKVSGGWNLHRLTAHLPLDCFVLFSSIASVMVNGGQGNYVAANAFVDALAHYRRAHGLPAVSINWGPWRDVGMAVHMTNIDDRLAREGLQAIEPQQGMSLLGQILQRNPAQVLAVSIDWGRYVARREGQELSPLLDRVIGEVQSLGRRQPAQERRGELLGRLQSAPEIERSAMLQDYVREQAARVLGLTSASQLEPARNLFEVGMDSLMAVELRNTLGNAMDTAFPAKLLFDFPSVAALTGFLASAAPIPEPAMAAATTASSAAGADLAGQAAGPQG